MLERRIEQEIRDFLKSDRKEALMVTGARQVGKTYIIRECAKEIYKNIVEINFVENQQAVKLFENITGSKDILLRLSALTDVPMIPGETLIFFDAGTDFLLDDMHSLNQLGENAKVRGLNYFIKLILLSKCECIVGGNTCGSWVSSVLSTSFKEKYIFNLGEYT